MCDGRDKKITSNIAMLDLKEELDINCNKNEKLEIKKNCD